MTRQDVPGAFRATSVRNLAESVLRHGRKVARRLFTSAYAASHSHAQKIETLEPRQLLAGVTFNDGILKVSGSDTAATTLTVAPSGSTNVIAKSGSISKTVVKSQIKKIEIYGGSANDTVRIDGSLKIASYIDARGGNDYVSSGGGNDEVWGDTGNDTVYGNAGDDSIAGEAGNDLLDGGDGTDLLHGGSGTNVLKNGTNSTAAAAAPAPSSSASISALELWDASTDKKIQTISSDSTIDLAKLPSSLTLVAQGTGASVKFGLDSNTKYRVENGKPWAIAGDNNGNLVGWSIPTGSHTIKLTPYTKTNATGTAGATKTFTLNVTRSSGSSAQAPAPSSAASISGLELWNADTDKKIQSVTSGSSFDLAKLPANLTLVAQGTGASVKFALDSNSNYRTENGKPWGIAGDNNGNLVKWSIPTGSHTIKVTPYTKTNASGSAGSVKTYSVNFTRSSGSSSSGGTSNPSAPTTGGIVPRNNSAASPNAVITAISNKSIHAGQSFHANAMASGLGTGTPLTARYVWDFGDPGSDFNTMAGFNAAHVYEDAGNYTVKLTLFNEAGKADTATTTVTVSSSGRKVYYVSTSGSDSNAGTSESAPLKTFAKARSKVADNTEIRFKGGQTFDVKDSITVYDNNVLFGSYGSGKATLKFSGAKDYTSIFYLGGQGHRERTVENLIFDSIYTSGTDQKGMPQAVGAAGIGDAVVNNEFRNVGYGVNAQANPDGLLVQDNVANLKSGIREYFFWGEGKDIVIQGNNVVNSVFAHIVRIAGVDRLNVSNNNFKNPKDSADGNTIRGVVTVHQGNYAYVANNTLSDGPTSLGPLGRDTGIAEKSARFHWAVLEGNTISNAQILLLHGLEHSILRNNYVDVDNTWAIELEAYDSNYGRGVVDTTIVNNTSVNDGSTGNFLRVLGESNGINLINNLYIAPKLVVGDTSSGGVLVFDNDLSSFKKITGNVWPVPTATKYAEGGYMYVWSNWSNSSGYKTPTEWNNYGVVLNDVFYDVSYSGHTPSSSSAAANAGVVWAGVFTDKNGKVRSATGSWSAGAVEV